MSTRSAAAAAPAATLSRIAGSILRVVIDNRAPLELEDESFRLQRILQWREAGFEQIHTVIRACGGAGDQARRHYRQIAANRDQAPARLPAAGERLGQH